MYQAPTQGQGQQRRDRPPLRRAARRPSAAFGEDTGVLAVGHKLGFERQEELPKDGRFSPKPDTVGQRWAPLRLDGERSTGAPGRR